MSNREKPLTKKDIEDFLEEISPVCKKHNIEIYADIGGDVGFQRPSKHHFKYETEVEEIESGIFTTGFIV
ncbi:hypothetical protein CGI95_12295 [Vibrio parahaemolyticus]|uniref:hypothetical protein n=1 Tax=Vibrio parahaemolyticus TaxID=670 RepID=UPI00111D89C6|nr:hypothetical protein [Vibrio parahaemolyticus]TOG93969.1 hypothetical protein CGI95_12295 [Vibrio parahaemolyticus]